MTFPIDAYVDGRRTLKTITWAKVFRVVRKDSVTVRWTDHDSLLEFDEDEDGVLQDYTPAEAPSWSSSRLEWGSTEGSSELGGTVTSGGTVDMEGILEGRWDRAAVDIWTVDWRYPWMGFLSHDVFTIHDQKRSGEIWEPEVRTLLADLDRQVGRVYNRHCDADLYDATRCGVTVGTYTHSGAVTAVTGWSDAHPRQRFRTDLSQASDYFRHGTLAWTTGNNVISGLNVFDVKYHANSNGEIELWTETPHDIEIGDDFTAKAGCGKAFNRDCQGDFTNAVEFKGFPWMPTTRRTMRSPSS